MAPHCGSQGRQEAQPAGSRDEPNADDSTTAPSMRTKIRRRHGKVARPPGLEHLRAVRAQLEPAAAVHPAQPSDERAVDPAQEPLDVALPPGLELACAADEAVLNAGDVVVSAAEASDTSDSEATVELGMTEEPVCCVAISGLPNGILSRPMMLAVLQQAGLEGEALRVTMRKGQPCGEARVRFSSVPAAARCICHFQNRQWDPSGTVVSAWVDWTGEPLASAGTQEDRLNDLLIADEVFPGGENTHKAPLPQKSEDMVDEPKRALEAVVTGSGPMQFSAGAPAFIPAFHPAIVEGAGGTPKANKLAVNSDTSTEMGDSDADDRGGLVFH